MIVLTCSQNFCEMAVSIEAHLERQLEIGAGAPAGTVHFFKKAERLGVEVSLRHIPGVYKSWDQTGVTLPEDAPDDLKKTLQGLVQAQESEHAVENARWRAEQRRREEGF